MNPFRPQQCGPVQVCGVTGLSADGVVTPVFCGWRLWQWRPTDRCQTWIGSWISLWSGLDEGGRREMTVLTFLIAVWGLLTRLFLVTVESELSRRRNRPLFFRHLNNLVHVFTQRWQSQVRWPPVYVPGWIIHAAGPGSVPGGRWKFTSTAHKQSKCPDISNIHSAEMCWNHKSAPAPRDEQSWLVVKLGGGEGSCKNKDLHPKNKGLVCFYMGR